MSAREQWRTRLTVHLPADVEVGVEADSTVPGAGPWLELESGDRDQTLTLFASSASAARRLVLGATAWAEEMEAHEARREAGEVDDDDGGSVW